MKILSFLKSPLLHFFAIGGLIFLAFAAVNDELPKAEADAIILSDQEAQRLAQQFAATWNREPTESELESLMRNWALEEAFVREALALGLDRGDAVIRQRLNLKMGYLAESGAAALQATDETLKDYLEENPERFTRPARLALDQVLIKPGSSEDDMLAIRTALQQGAAPSDVGIRSLLPVSMPMTPVPAIDRTFGEGFSASLAKLLIGTWQGPVKSGYGLHMVRITDREEATTPPLEAIREQVETEWRAAKAQEMKEAYGQALLERYTVSLPPADRVLDQ